ncbi:dTDP-4-dehydrorhamnose reductase subunit, NAD(P)-binding, of dTDP-L-rhamnose synthase [Cupriavidus taiwanensis]|uniref:dTDP-4-dehydrorhamnose reductase n=1 Tax=Cupriavidus taiwanensis TaxID=164546 RepID=UPI000E19409A|nr:dTDP-4-dehydrorhamnose reductase [Cupriavidus taiwanensis]SOZ98499.1 dTDP-4-dehydrorhamnose reductase subunit, NAD(P)-binding, of dTDP-L-rhamnose synthase [Cupriavidus taiwanensis]
MPLEYGKFPRILLIGANGQLGFELTRSLALHGTVVAVDRRQCDLTDADRVRGAVRAARPDIIVNAAAYTAVDLAEREIDLANAVNVVAPGILAEEAAHLGALVVHYSTDYVFDGEKAGAYVETDAPNPLSAYGKSKLGGERMVQAATANHLIFRTSWVYGLHGGNFLKSIVRAATTRESLSVVSDQWGAPTPASLVADVTAVAVGRYLNRAEQDFIPGIYHLAALGETNWCDYAKLIVRYLTDNGVPLSLGADDIRAITAEEYGSPAPRPANSRLDTSKLRDGFGIAIPEWHRDVERTLREFIDIAEFALVTDACKTSKE